MPMTREQQAFADKVAKFVKKYAPNYGIEVYSPVVAQAILESGWGSTELAKNAKNFFGIKYRKDRCPTAIGVYTKVGSEQNPDGTYVHSTMQWCKFKNMDGCVHGYFDFINVDRYSNLKGVKSPKEYLEKIKADEYATSLNYVDNLMRVIKDYNLIQYDPKSAPQSNTIYKIQVGAYSQRANAEAQLSKLKKAGFDGIIVEVTTK